MLYIFIQCILHFVHATVKSFSQTNQILNHIMSNVPLDTVYTEKVRDREEKKEPIKQS